MHNILPFDQVFLIFCMALVTYIPRVLPLWLLSSRALNPAFMRWLEMLPPAVLAALLAPAILLRKGEAGQETLFFDLDNTFLLAALPAFLVAHKTKSFFWTVAVGMAAVALLRRV